MEPKAKSGPHDIVEITGILELGLVSNLDIVTLWLSNIGLVNNLL